MRWFLLGLGALAWSALGCHSAVQPTAYMGDGLHEGEPPLCFQHREESRPTNQARTLLVHFNNTCDFALDCLVYNDVTEQEQRAVVIANGRATLLVAAGTDASRFDVELSCQWHE
jgi:hypothetical protein